MQLNPWKFDTKCLRSLFVKKKTQMQSVACELVYNAVTGIPKSETLNPSCFMQFVWQRVHPIAARYAHSQGQISPKQLTKDCAPTFHSTDSGEVVRGSLQTANQPLPSPPAKLKCGAAQEGAGSSCDHLLSNLEGFLGQKPRDMANGGQSSRSQQQQPCLAGK